MSQKGLAGVFGTGRIKTAGRTPQGGQDALIGPDEKDDGPNRYALSDGAHLDMLSKRMSSDEKAGVDGRSAAGFFAMTLMSQFPRSRWRFNLKYSRTYRLMRFRATAQPTFLVTVMPKRGRWARPDPKLAIKYRF